MGRCLRHVPEGGAMMEITTRTIQGRFLLRPSKDLNEIVLGIGGAQRRSDRAYSIYSVHL